MDAGPANAIEPTPYRSPEIRRSSLPVIQLPAGLVVRVEVPNLEYAADANPPTCRVLPAKRYEAEAVPWTSNNVWGVVVLIPTLPLPNTENREAPPALLIPNIVSVAASACTVVPFFLYPTIETAVLVLVGVAVPITPLR